ncbi:MAG: branched-chain amino acid transaminase [Nitrospirota bacterium]|nr:branched-chain amino acid transaminase [Nitrospirota bacterium]
MLTEGKVIWMDGKLVPWGEANVHVLTHALHYGMGVFEGIRAYQGADGGAIFRLPEHTRRLFDSAHILGLKMPFSQDEINRATLETVRANGLSACYIRPIAFLGYGAMGLYAPQNPVNVSIAAWPWGSYLGEEGLSKGIRVQVSGFVRNHVNSAMTRAKVAGYYVNSVLAKMEAKASGYDEALLTDTSGFLAEGAGENLFIVRDGVIHTPVPTAILPGITRDSVMILARERGYTVVERPITRDELYIADEAFFTGSAAEVTPIREVDHRVIGSGKRGPVTEVLQNAYFDCVNGRDPKHKGWLTPL